MRNFTIESPLPSRGAAIALQGQIVRHVVGQRMAVGDPLMSGKQIMEISGLSQATVQRALDKLQREGWVERRVGRGTFVGPRAGAPSAGTQTDAPSDASPASRPATQREASVVRLAVLIFGIGDLAHDWYTPLVLEGLDEAAEQYRIGVELLGNRDRDVDAISRRLVQNRPDVLACLSADPKQALVIRDAQRLGIPCLVTGTPYLGLGLPAICEDNRQAMKLAVRHLIEKGHRRIGLILPRQVEPWVFDRHEAFQEMMAEAELEVDEGLVHWTPFREPPESGSSLEGVWRYLSRRRPTAVVAGGYVPMRYLNRLVLAGRLRVPEDLSLVTFEQNITDGEWLGGVRPTAIRLPLREMGRRLAEMARALAEGRPAVQSVSLPAELVEGETVSSVPAGLAAADTLAEAT